VSWPSSRILLNKNRPSLSDQIKTSIYKQTKSENLKSSVTALKNTEAFKELEQYVAEFSGA